MNILENLTTGIEIKEQLYEKELNTKKDVLDYIQIVKKQRNELTQEQLETTYVYIENCINDMASHIKPNTVLYLKNELNSNLGKYAGFNEKNKLDYFIEFFKEAYPDGKRRKDYTWVLADSTKITEEQILHTLKYINAKCLKGNRLMREQKLDILKRIDTIAYKGTLKYINQIKSLEGLGKAINFKIVKTDKSYKVEYFKK